VVGVEVVVDVGEGDVVIGADAVVDVGTPEVEAT
jgi:hypothetical protein